MVRAFGDRNFVKCPSTSGTVPPPKPPSHLGGDTRGADRPHGVEAGQVLPTDNRCKMVLHGHMKVEEDTLECLIQDGSRKNTKR